MPHDRDDWISRIKSIEREHLATSFALRRMVSAAERDPTLLEGGMRLRELRHASEHLDGTYLIRLFAAFEAGLRLYWTTLKKSNPQARGLLEALAARRSIPTDTLAQAHAVRECRNSLVHESASPSATIPMAAARRHLCTFFSYLPRTW